MQSPVDDTDGHASLFRHSNVGGDFQNRVDSVFGSLKSLEKKYDENLPAEDNIYLQDCPVVDFPSEDGEFKKPCSGRSLFKGKRSVRGVSSIPDHLIHPEKWVKYRYCNSIECLSNFQ